MKKIKENYLAIILLLFIILLLTVIINVIPNINIGNQMAAVLDILPTNTGNVFGYAWNDKIGWINFGTSSDRNEGQVYLSDNKLYGYAWGENIGWISFNCENDNSCDVSNYAVTQNNSDGVLTGYAWGENIGWINFAPEGGGVTVTTNTSATNTFAGYAWGENIGWISFSNETPEYGVFTTWTKTAPAVPTPPSGGSSYISQLCVYDNPEWSACSSEGIQIRTLTALIIPCLGETTKEESQSCINESIIATTTSEIETPTTTVPIKISIEPKKSIVEGGDKIKFTATISGTTNDEVEWFIYPFENIVENFYGSIDDNGLYSAPNRAVTIVVIAKAKADTSAVDMLQVNVRLKEIKEKEDLPTTNINEVIKNPETKTTEKIENYSEKEDPIDTQIEKNDNSQKTPEKQDKNLFLVLAEAFKKTVINGREITESKVGSITIKTIGGIGIIGGGLASSQILIFSGTSIVDLLSLPLRLWSLLLSVFGLKKRNKPWGTVYDSVTKQPLDPAYLVIKDAKGKEVDMSITDLDGRYGFLTQQGKYTIIANKTNYLFPSKKMLGKKADILYKDLYFGEEIDIQNTGTLINKDIPLDPIKFDWNEFTKKELKMTKFYSNRDKIVKTTTDLFFRTGFLVSILSLLLVTNPYNFIILGLYIIIALLRKFGLKTKSFGYISDKKGKPLSYAIIKIIDPVLNIAIINKVADQFGRYYCLVPKGKYQIKIDKKDTDENYSSVYNSEIMEIKDGIINKNFII